MVTSAQLEAPSTLVTVGKNLLPAALADHETMAKFKNNFLPVLAGLVEQKVTPWPQNDATETSLVSGLVGVQPQGDKRRELNALLQGQPHRVRRLHTVSEEVVGEKKSIPILRLHLLLTASPSIAAFRDRHIKTIQWLKTVCDTNDSDLNRRLSTCQVEEIEAQIRIFQEQRSGVREVGDMPESADEEGIAAKYEEVLAQSLAFGTNGINRIPITREMIMNSIMSHTSDDIADGVMNVVIVTGPEHIVNMRDPRRIPQQLIGYPDIVYASVSSSANVPVLTIGQMSSSR